MYVVEKILMNAQAAEADDLIRVEEIDTTREIVVLQPLLADAYEISLKEFEDNYCVA